MARLYLFGVFIHDVARNEGSERALNTLLRRHVGARFGDPKLNLNAVLASGDGRGESAIRVDRSGERKRRRSFQFSFQKPFRKSVRGGVTL
jgi:hypothetical protein